MNIKKLIYNSYLKNQFETTDVYGCNHYISYYYDGTLLEHLNSTKIPYLDSDGRYNINYSSKPRRIVDRFGVYEE